MKKPELNRFTLSSVISALPFRAVAAIGVTSVIAWTSARGDTYVSGNVVNQTWTKAGSPFRVTGDVVASDLTIGPGVAVLFEINCVFRVAGRLTAVGSAAEPILFTRTDVAGGWQGIYFNQNPPGSELAYCVVSRSVNSGISVYRATPVIRNCMIIDNSSPNVGGGIVITNNSLAGGDVTLRDCVVSNNTSRTSGGGIFAIMGTNTLAMQDCRISGNEVNPTHLVGSVTAGGVRIQGNGRFLNSEIHGNRCNGAASSATVQSSVAGGVYSDQGTVVFVASSISHNLAQGTSGVGVNCYGGGICVASGELNATNSVLFENGLRTWGGGSDARGSGLYVSGSSTRASLVNCVVAHNTNMNSDVSASGVSFFAGTNQVVNSTIAYNDGCGLYRSAGAVAVRNSIIYFNAVTPEICGTAAVTHSCVGGGYAGVGNISLEPFFTSSTNFILLPFSPCIDAGNPSPAYNDVCFPPSLGSVTNDIGAYGGPLACSWPTTPRILVQPPSQNACLGTTVTFCVQAWGEEPLAYQWLYNSNVIAGATNSCLTAPVTDTNQAGVYAVVVTNVWGTVTSEGALLTVSPTCLSIALHPGLTINGEVGRTYTLEWASKLEDPDWRHLTNILLSTPEMLWFDPTPATKDRRFYRIKP